MPKSSNSNSGNYENKDDLVFKRREDLSNIRKKLMKLMFTATSRGFLYLLHKLIYPNISSFLTILSQP